MPNVKPDGFVSPPSGRGLARYANQTFRWKSCRDKGDQCAKVRVPLDYAKPDGQAITLTVARKPGSKPSKGTLFINPGGPGASGINFLDDFRDQDLGAYTIMTWDPRGVGESTPVECFGDDQMRTYTEMDSTPDTAKERQAWQRANEAFGRSCLQRSGALLEHVSTEETARDLDLLRQISGAATINYFGFSYGTDIGARYADLFPKQVGRMVLDGAVPLDSGDTGSNRGSAASSAGVSQTQGFDRALNDFAEWAAKNNSRLGSSKKAVLKRITGLWDDLDRRPLPVGPRRLTQALAVTGTQLVLYSNKSYYKYLNTAFERALNGDGAVLVAYADAYNDRSKKGHYGQFNDAFPAIRCLDNTDNGINGALAAWKRDKKVAPSFGPYGGPDFACPSWPVAPFKNTTGKITATGAAPIVVIGTTRDPATPYEYAKAMAKQLDSGVLVTLKGEGHLAYDQSACVRRAINPYLLTGKVPRNGTTCSS